MADEKLMLGRNELNRLNKAFEKKLQKRLDAPPVTTEKANEYAAGLAAAPAAPPVTTPATAGTFDWITQWKKYYPFLVMLMGWADAFPFFPSAPVRVLKAVFAFINDEIIPLFENMAAK